MGMLFCIRRRAVLFIRHGFENLGFEVADYFLHLLWFEYLASYFLDFLENGNLLLSLRPSKSPNSHPSIAPKKIHRVPVPFPFPDFVAIE